MDANNVVPAFEFNAFTRCDRCGSQAYSHAQKNGHQALLFCMHHRNKHHSALLNTGWTVTDDAEGIESLIKSQGASV